MMMEAKKEEWFGAAFLIKPGQKGVHLSEYYHSFSWGFQLECFHRSELISWLIILLTGY